jgi:hypothetical protein
MFYHILTGIKGLKAPVKVSFTTTLVQGFREYLKDQNNDGEVKQKSISRQLVLLPKYNPKLTEDQFSIPHALTPLFNEQSMSQLKSYQASLETNFTEPSDLDDLTYYLE